MPEGGEISISVARSGGYVDLVFADTGHGIDEEIKDKVFDPFFSTKEPTRGTGLGLSICYSIIKDHGGSIKITRTETGGSRFVISLPVDGDED